MLKIEELVTSTNGKYINGDKNYIPQNYIIDSRLANKGDFFVPLIGENTDGHKYILDCVKSGISGFFISSEYDKKEEVIKDSININKDICIIEVLDTQKALFEAGKYNREKHINIPVITVSGSVGKTSTREMIASVLKMEKNVLVTQKNFNSCIGAPIMTLKMDNQDVCVFEAGIDDFNQMEMLSDLLKPDVCVLTVIGTSHIAALKTQENIFNEKLKITSNIKGIKKVVLNSDDKYLKNVLSNDKYKTVFFGKDQAYNITITDDNIEFDTNIYNKKEHIVINQIGNHNINNALCAIRVGEIFNLKVSSIIKGIQNYKNFNKRLEKKYVKDILIIDDTYNASIDSMLSGLDTVNNLKSKRKIAVLGDMLELGEMSNTLHSKVGESFKNLNFNYLFAYGDYAKNIYESGKQYFNEDKAKWFNSKEEMLQNIEKVIRKDDIIYFKASNALKFFEIIDKLIKYIEKSL